MPTQCAAIKWWGLFTGKLVLTPRFFRLAGLPLALGLAAAVLRWLALAQTPFANGWDSYFYLVQLKSWIETGHMHSPEASLVYPLMRGFVWLFGDYVSGYKWCAASLAGWAVGLAAWGNIKQAPTGAAGQSAPRFWSASPALLPALILLFSPQLTFFTAQYPKNLLGFAFFLCLVYSMPEKPGEGWRAVITPLIWLIINYFGHRLTFVLSALYLLFWAMWAYGVKIRGVLSGRQAGIALLVLAILSVLASWLFPGLFHPADLERLSGVLGKGFQFAPWSFVQDFGPSRMKGWWLAEIAVAVLLLLLTAVRLAVKPWRMAVTLRTKALFTLGILLLFPGLEWSMTGVVCRFFMVYVLLAPLMAFDGRRMGMLWSYTTGILLFAGALLSWRSYVPSLHDPDYRLFAQVTAAASTDETYSSARPLLVIAPNALAEYFTFTTGVDALPWLPEYPVDTARLWRIAGQMRQKTVEYYANGSVCHLPGGYLWVREDRWQAALERARMEGDSVYVEQATGWPNPSRQRPAYLLRRKQANAGQ